jgi:Aminotransferase class I and II
VVTDSAFSMDGDTADVVVDLCAAHGALLVLDEAHAVLGPDLDAASAAARGVTVLRVGTLSKALGSLGGFVAGPHRYVDLLLNRARPFIFTTAPTPADMAAARAALAVLRSSEGTVLVARLRGHVERLRPGHPTPIVPVLLGDEAAALAAAAELLDRGLLVPAIRPPTVPEGTCRLRVALSAAHTDAHLDRLIAGLAHVSGGDGPGCCAPVVASQAAGAPKPPGAPRPSRPGGGPGLAAPDGAPGPSGAPGGPGPSGAPGGPGPSDAPGGPGPSDAPGGPGPSAPGAPWPGDAPLGERADGHQA